MSLVPLLMGAHMPALLHRLPCLPLTPVRVVVWWVTC